MVDIKTFGTLTKGPFAGTEVHLYKLHSEGNPFSLTVSDYGAVIYNAELTDSNGKVTSLVRGYDTLDFYERAPGYLGAVVGRVGNRIARGHFELDGKEYKLFINNLDNHLHGGEFGFNFKVYSVEYNDRSIMLSCVSPDGDEGYPGKLEWSVTYTLLQGGFTIEYNATSDAATPINLTNHSYFNLDGCGLVNSYSLKLDCDRFIPTDNQLIPTGVIAPVDGTVFDFRDGKTLDEAISSDDQNIIFGAGIDHCFVFPEDKTGYRHRATLCSPASGICMDYFTDTPCVQVYTGNYLNEKDFPFRGNEAEEVHSAVCFESEYYIDAINHPGFKGFILRPGEKYYTKTGYFFGFSK